MHNNNNNNNININNSSSSTNQSSLDGNDKSTNTIERGGSVGGSIKMDEHRTIDNDDVHKKFPLKKDDLQARSYSDVRKSAPDVVIISGCTSSH